MLLVRPPDAGVFRFSVDGYTRVVDAYAPAVDGGGIAWVRAPRNGRATHTVEVAALDGSLRFNGVLSEPAPRSARPPVEVLALERAAATLAGCRYAPVFADLWSASGSVAEGYTADGIHPTPAGYRAISKALAGAIAAPLRSRGARPRGPAPARGGA